jgi:hypothetical protein
MEQSTATPVHFLGHEHWSPRFDSEFFTVKMETVESLAAPPTFDPSIGGNSNHPAYYYKIDVFCAHSSRSVYRRYSQFHKLYQQLCSSRPRDDTTADPLVMPPRTCFCQPQDKHFAENRLEQLREFLRDALQRPGYATHPAMVLFLELNEISI